MSTTRVNQDWVSGFTADTPILMADGTFKSISEIKPGDQVASFDSRTGDSVAATVSEVFCDIYDDSLEITVDDNKMVVAASQLFYTPDMEFKSAVEAGFVVTVEGVKTLRCKRYKGGKVRFYDISVDKTHVFIADGLLVHNKKAGNTTKTSVSKKNNTSTAKNDKKASGKVNQNNTDQKKKDKAKDKVKVNVNVNVKVKNKITNNIIIGGKLQAEDEILSELSEESSASYDETLDDEGFPGDEGNDYTAPSQTRNPVPSKAINELESAQKKRNAVCKDLGSIKKNPSKAQVKKYSEALQAVIADVNDAKKADPEKSRDSNYVAVNTEIKALKNFIKDTKTFNAKQKKFITEKCGVIQKNIKKALTVLNNLDNGDTGSGGGSGGSGGSGFVVPIYPIRPKPPVSPGNPESDVNRIYSNDPKYDYFARLPNLDNTGCTGYVEDNPAGDPKPFIGNAANNSGYTSGYTNSDLWYKHFDPNRGKFYYSKSSQNCL